MDVQMAATPLAPPSGSPLDIQAQGDLELQRLEAEAHRKLYAPVLVSAGEQDEESIKASRDAEFNEAMDWISIVQQVNSRKYSRAQWEIQQETQKRDDETSEEWIDRLTKKFDVYPHPNAEVIVASSTPCDIPDRIVDGCVIQDMIFSHPTGWNMKMYIADKAVGDAYVLFHEIAHTKGILDECAADNYSRSVTGLPGGYYCE